MLDAQKTDILLIGAGLVGTSLIVALKQQGLRIRVLEHHLPQVMTKTATDSRPVALSYGSQRILQSLGLWGNLAPLACPISAVHVSNQGTLGRIHFAAQELQVPALGYVVPYDDLQQALYHQAANQEGVEFISSEEIISIHCDDLGGTVVAKTANGEQTFSAELLIATDGTRSTARKLLQIETAEKNDQEIAATALITLREPHQSVAYERFTDQGTLALLPLSDAKKYRLVWTLSQTAADELTNKTNTQIIDEIQQIFHNRLPSIVDFQWDHRYPVTTVIAKEKIRPSFVLLGNAAQTIYPLAAQGFNLALRDVAVLSEVLIEARAAQQLLGDLSVLRKYVDWRSGDQQRTIGITRQINNLFGYHWPLANRARGLGLLATDLILPLKKRLAWQLMGLSGRLPKLMRGVP